MTNYPLSRYEIDQHVDAGLTNLSGTVDAIPHALSAMIWSIDRHVVDWIIRLFGAAFSVDLLNGDSALSAAVNRSTKQLYDQLAQPLLTSAILAAGIWALYQLLVLRRYADGGAKLAAALGYCLLCMGIVLAPNATIGTVSTIAHNLSTATLAAAMPGSGPAATENVTNGLRRSLIHEPWMMLEFGGTTKCVDGDGDEADAHGANSDGSTVPPRGGSCIDTHKLAPNFLKHAPGSDERKDAFEDLDDGSDLEKAAVRIQTASAGYDRVAIALGLLVAAIGAVILIGGLSLGMIAAQLYALLLICCAPVALLASFIPGAGHHFVRVWLTQLLGAMFRGTVFCLYLAISATLSIALAKTAPAIGSVGALTLQAALWWGLVIYGRTLSSRLAAGASSIPSPRLAVAAKAATRAIPSGRGQAATT